MFSVPGEGTTTGGVHIQRMEIIPKARLIYRMHLSIVEYVPILNIETIQLLEGLQR